MNTEILLKELDVIFCRVLDKKGVNLTLSTTAKDVDGWDSLTNMQLISEIEKHFELKFKLREIIKLKDVGDLVNTIVSKTSN